MWANRKSIQCVVDEDLRRSPAYCPNAECANHHSKEGLFHRHGRRTTRRYPYTAFRFRCQRCGKTFSQSFFTLSYRDRLNDIYEEIFDLHVQGVSKRQIARFLHCSEETIRRKIAKLARWSLLRWARDLTNTTINEAIAYDGIENFSFSQFEPNNLNHAIGKQSYFIYDFNFAPLNRKGKMSERQKLRKRSLDETYGKFPTSAIRASTRKLVHRLLAQTRSRTLEFHSDNHFAYREALEPLAPIVHKITPAKLARNYRNRLFPINHLDLLTRQNLAAFKRETIAFAKHSVAMLESFSLFVAFKNYMRPIFYKEHARDPCVHLDTPAMRLGLTTRPLSFREFFSSRLTRSQVTLHSDFNDLFHRQDPLSRHPIRPYLGI